MQVSMRALAVLAALALSTVSAAPMANSTMSLGDGTTVSTNESTIFLGTEYNPDKCPLQFTSLQCKLSPNDNCAQLNGYPLQCVNLGRQNGKDKLQCQCRANETDVCQNSTAPTTSGVPQFGDCSDNKPCVDSYGLITTSTELKICAEKIHCVKEINTTATDPAQICHTCRSCIAQNDAQNEKLSDKRRFDCTKICPKEILDSIAKRNEQGVGIADEISSNSDSTSGSGEESSASTDGTMATTAPSATKKTDSSAMSVSASTIVASIVVTALSVVLMH